MQPDYIIVGQGISGSFLSWYLIRQGKRVLVIDEPQNDTASKIASGIINPVTGKRMALTWLAGSLLPFTAAAYEALGKDLGTQLVRRAPILDFYPTREHRDIFAERAKADPEYLEISSSEEPWDRIFRFNYGIGQIDQGMLVDLPALLKGWRMNLKERGALLEEKFTWDNVLVAADHIHYGSFTAKKIICCGGAAASDNPYFKMLPWSRNKGEALIVTIPGLPRTHIFKQGLTIVPWKEDQFWIGAGYDWNYTDLLPTVGFRKRTEEQLDYWLKLRYKVTDHIASERPATVGQRPFAGLHPLFPAIGILNGMGSKGCSLAPYFASQLSFHLTHGKPIDPEVDISRFTRILSRQ